MGCGESKWRICEFCVGGLSRFGESKLGICEFCMGGIFRFGESKSWICDFCMGGQDGVAGSELLWREQVWNVQLHVNPCNTIQGLGGGSLGSSRGVIL